MPETARARPLDETETEEEHTRPMDKTVPLLRKTQPLDADDLYRRAKAAQEDENYQEAVRLFRLSADAGNAEAMEWLGIRYYMGRGVDEDKAQAVVWYRKAAEAGNAEAMYRLGDCYFYGRGVDKDEIQAAEWYQKAVRKGSIFSNFAKKKLNEMRRKGLI